MAKASIRSAKRAKRQFDEFVEQAAWYIGWFGVALLVCCALLWLIPKQHWDGWLKLDADRLPIYTVGALICASLVGWRFVNLGEERLTKKFGKTFSLVIFLVIPIACLLIDLAQRPIAEATNMHPPDHPFWQFIRWYPPAVIVACAANFLLWKSRPRKRVYFERGLGYALLLLPYAMLFTFIQLGVHLDWLDESMRDTLASLGQWSIALQLVLAYFVGTG